MKQTGQIQGRKRQRRRKIPHVVLKRLEQKFQVSIRTICRWITAGEKDVVETAVEYVRELIVTNKAARTKVGNLNTLLDELSNLAAMPLVRQGSK